MPILSVRCPVSRERVSQVVNLQGGVKRVICPEYEVGGTCRLMKTSLKDGPLTQLLECNSEHASGLGGTACIMRVPAGAHY
jgi:hypothetical protein